MGYTHYWTTHQPIPDEVWHRITQAAAAASVAFVAMTGTRLAWDYDEPERPCQFSTDSRGPIRFNGVGDEGHETFLLDPEPTGFDFCKTAEKPYDTLVTAVLCIAESLAPGYIQVTSDGDREEWSAGLDLAQTVLDAVSFPKAIREAAA